METARTEARSPSQTKHERAVRRTLQWAEDAAACGDHADALAWLQTLEAAGHELSSEYENKREEWQLALGGVHAADGANGSS